MEQNFADLRSEERVGATTFSDILASLSVALDLASGHYEGHSVRTGVIAARLARDLYGSDDDIIRVYFASMLKDIGCIDLRHRLKMMVKDDNASNDLTASITHPAALSGATIGQMLGFDARVVDAILHHGEKWDGSGNPSGLRSETIPFLSRVIGIAQFMDAGVCTSTIENMYIRLREVGEKWFDPMAVQAAFDLRNDKDFWERHRAFRLGWIRALPMPERAQIGTGASIDSICEAFSLVIDAQSSFTGDHSSRVTSYATWLAQHFDFDKKRIQTIRRAALLHDIGKLKVPNHILEKPGKLSRDEFELIKLHPKHSAEILSKISGFERITEIAGAHHEKLDGMGYHKGLSANDLDLDMRVLAAADVFDALTATRPYRGRMTVRKALDIMGEDAGRHLDPDCVLGFEKIFAKQTYVAA